MMLSTIRLLFSREMCLVFLIDSNLLNGQPPYFISVITIINFFVYNISIMIDSELVIIIEWKLQFDSIIFYSIDFFFIVELFQIWVFEGIFYLDPF